MSASLHTLQASTSDLIGHELQTEARLSATSMGTKSLLLRRFSMNWRKKVADFRETVGGAFWGCA